MIFFKKIKKYLVARKILAILPGSNCQSCGELNCESYAHAIVFRNYAVDLCPMCDRKMLNEINSIIKKHKKKPLIY